MASNDSPSVFDHGARKIKKEENPQNQSAGEKINAQNQK